MKNFPKSKTKKGWHCGYCGFDNNGNAKKCTYCSGDLPEWKAMKKEHKGVA